MKLLVSTMKLLVSTMKLSVSTMKLLISPMILFKVSKEKVGVSEDKPWDVNENLGSQMKIVGSPMRWQWVSLMV